MQEQINKDCRTAAIGCIDCKKLVADRMVEQMAPMWEARTALTSNPSRIDDIIQDGSRRATQVARATLAEVNAAMKI